VAQTSKSDVLWAVQSGLKDFEDALQLSAAICSTADIVITRNTTDFKNSPIPVMTPEEFLATHP
jgi:predicted nucleic acid-binding protein